jgi:hypothetical protein
LEVHWQLVECMEAAERVSKRLMDMPPGKSGYYMSLANICSDAGRYDDADRVRKLKLISFLDIVQLNQTETGRSFIKWATEFEL